MKNILLMIGLTAFTVTGAVLTPNKVQTQTGRSTAAKKSPTPAKKNTASSKPNAGKNSTATTKTTPKPAAQKPAVSATKPAIKPATKKDDKAELDNALAIEDSEQKVKALTKFLADFPKSELRPRAIESLTAARIAAGDTKLAQGDRENGLKLTRAAISEAPLPYPEKLFNEVIAKVPQTLYYRGEPAAAGEIAAAIEKNLSTAPQLVSLAGFYLNSENALEAKRLAEAAIKLDEKSGDAYLTLGMAHRLNFDLDAAAAAFEKAVEIDPESVSGKQSLAEMKRALGKTDEALAIFSSLLEKDPNDVRSQNGKILTLFDAGKRADAESELAKGIEANPNNVVLIGGAAYWYAAKGDSVKAIDLAGKAMSIEPRYIWSHIALAKAYAIDGRLGDAEQVLIKARKYGDFPTLEYEIALVRLASGFYREASDELAKSFTIRDGSIVTKLGRRAERSDKSFGELIANERRASILEPQTFENIDADSKLKALLELRTVLSSSEPNAIRASELVDSFTAGLDKMRFHRQIFAANELLEKKIAPAKALELTRSAVSAVDDGLAVGEPAAPIMAGELYTARTRAFANDKYVLTPDVPKPTLSAIARGRIEEIAGWSLLQQGSNAEAATRFRRAVNILPEKSAWWRSSYWRLGNALEAEGKDKDALDAYVKSYTSSTEPDAARYASIETVYKRVNGGGEGLDKLIGDDPSKPKPAEVVAAATPEARPSPSPEVRTETKTEVPIEKKSEISAEKKDPPIDNIYVPVAPPSIEPRPTPAETPQQRAAEETKKAIDEQVPEVKTSPSPAPTPESSKPIEEKILDPKPSPTPEQEIAKPLDEKAVEPKPLPKPTEEPTVKTEERTSEIKPLPTPQAVVEKAIDDQRVASTTSARNEEVPSSSDTAKPGTKSSPKPLFEPVIIEIKNSKPPPKGEAKKAEPERTSGETSKSEPIGRPRVVEGKEIPTEVSPECSISVSQETISLIRDGGSVGLLVGVDGGNIKDVKFVSSSPKDVAVIAEPEIAGVSGRALYVIKSLTASAGVYQVNFSSPCGRKEVTVKVR